MSGDPDNSKDELDDFYDQFDDFYDGVDDFYDEVDDFYDEVDEFYDEIDVLRENDIYKNFCNDLFNSISTSTEKDKTQYFSSITSIGYQAFSHVFQYLSIQGLLSLSRVCKTLRNHPSLWKYVRLENICVTDWNKFSNKLLENRTQHLDLQKMNFANEATWSIIGSSIPRITNLIKLEISHCPGTVLKEIITNCPQLQVLRAEMIKCDSLDLESVRNMKSCTELKVNSDCKVPLETDLTPLLILSKLTHLSLTSIKNLSEQNIGIIQNLVNLESLEIGELQILPDTFGSFVLKNLQKLSRLKIVFSDQHTCIHDTLEAISQLKNLKKLALVNFQIESGFEKFLSKCTNIQSLFIMPFYDCKNVNKLGWMINMILNGVINLKNNLKMFVWVITNDLLNASKISSSVASNEVESLPVLRPVPCFDTTYDNATTADDNKEIKGTYDTSEIEILSLVQIKLLLAVSLPKTCIKILNKGLSNDLV